MFTNQDLKRLILPLIVEQILAVSVGMVDTMMVSNAGEAATSGVSLVDTVNILLINVFSALATGGAVVAGHYLGQKHKEEASKVAWQILMFASSLALVISIIFIAFHDGLLRLMFGQIEADVMQSAKTYLIITAISFTGLAIYNSCAAIFRAMNNARVTMWISLLINTVNLIGNTICIYGLKWGVAGAAIPTTLSRYVGAIVILVMMFNPTRDINFCGQVRFRFNPVLIKRILYIAVPNGLENSMFQLGKILVLSVVSTMGTSAIAANATANTLANWNILFGSAINLGLVSVSAVCIGAGEIEQTRYYTRKMMKIAIALTSLMSVILFVSVPVLVKLYNLGPEASQMAIEVMRFHNIMAILFWVPSFTIPNTLRSAGDVIGTMIIAIFSMWVFRIGAAYLFTYVFHLGLLGVWAAMVVDWIFRAICYVIRYRGHRWETAMQRQRA